MQRNRSKYLKVPAVYEYPVDDEGILYAKVVTWHPTGLVKLVRDSEGTECQLGWSLCNPVDRFYKDEARAIAQYKLEKEPIVVDLANINNIATAINKLPHSLRDTALWLVEYEMRVFLRDQVREAAHK